MKTLSLRKKSLIALLLVFVPSTLLIFIGTRSCEHNFTKLDDYGKIHSYTFTNINGENKNSDDFKNTIVVINTLQESCPKKCGIAFWPFERSIYQQIRKNQKKLNKVRIISFVIDEDGNPVKDLSNMQQILKDNVLNYDPKLWILASGDPKKIFNIEHNGVNLLDTQTEDKKKTAYKDLILLVDKKNHLRMALRANSKSPEGEGITRRMKQSLALLLKQYDKEKK